MACFASTLRRRLHFPLRSLAAAITVCNRSGQNCQKLTGAISRVARDDNARRLGDPRSSPRVPRKRCSSAGIAFTSNDPRRVPRVADRTRRRRVMLGCPGRPVAVTAGYHCASHVAKCTLDGCATRIDLEGLLLPSSSTTKYAPAICRRALYARVLKTETDVWFDINDLLC